jgi:hypothetical protein
MHKSNQPAKVAQDTVNDGAVPEECDRDALIEKEISQKSDARGVRLGDGRGDGEFTIPK